MDGEDGLSNAQVTEPAANSTTEGRPASRSSKRRAAKQNAARQNGRNPESDDRSKRKSQPAQRAAIVGFGDGIERAICARFQPAFATGFPAHHRTGVATISPVIVDRRPTAILLCNSLHEGPHFWPNGDPVDDTEA